MKVSLIQLEIKETESNEALIERVFGLIDNCRSSDIIVLPELWHVGILSYRTIWDFAQEKDGPLMRRLSAKAKELDVFIHCGSFVQKDKDKIFNTSVLFDRRGTDVAEYRKIHLFSCYGREADSFSHGERPVVVDTEFGKLGLAICYDLRFPELFRVMTYGMGAEIFIVPAAWPEPRGEIFRFLNMARAAENVAGLVSCNMAGAYKHLTMVGGSCVVDPWGRITSELAREAGVVSGEISSDTVRRIRREFPVSRDIRLTGRVS